MKGFILLGLLAGISYYSQATVNMKNANYSESFLDLKVEGEAYDLRIRRSYNSRSLFNGLFGFGWCSDFESSLNVTAEGTIKLTECGGGLERTFATKSFRYKNLEQTIENIIGKERKKTPSLTRAALKSMRRKLQYDTVLREQLSRRHSLSGAVVSGKRYYNLNRDDEYIILNKGVYQRHFPGGRFERYSKAGKLLLVYDKNGNYLKIHYNKNKTIQRVVDNKGNQLNFRYKAGSNKVSQIIGPKGLKANYIFKGEDLFSVRNAWGNAYQYEYDNYHNLTSIKYPDKTSVQLTYNVDRDWVLTFQNRRKCLEKYVYRDNPKDPVNHYYSDLTKTCGKKVINKSSFEFVHKKRSDGSLYLHRTVRKNNGVYSETVYHPGFGKPISKVKGGISTKYAYFDSGKLRLKESKYQKVSYEYKGHCGKVSRIVAIAKDPRRIVASKKNQKFTTFYEYSKKLCNLTKAASSLGQSLVLSYARGGRLSKMRDHSGRTLRFEFKSSSETVSKITLDGFGSIVFKYSSKGELLSAKSPKGGPLVAKRIFSIISDYEEILGPAKIENLI